MAVIVEVYDQVRDIESVTVEHGVRWELSDHGVLDVYAKPNGLARTLVATFASGEWRSVKLETDSSS